jgi:hypothetical protein
VLWALSRVQVSKSIEIIANFIIDDSPINMLMTNVLRRVNPDYGFRLKIIAKGYCQEFVNMLYNLPLIHKPWLIKDEMIK